MPTAHRLPRTIVFNMVIALYCAASVAVAQNSVDRIRRVSGNDSGKLTATSVLDVTLTKGGVDKKIPAEEIVTVQLAGEPNAMNAVRRAFDAGRYAEVLQLLEKIDAAKLRRAEATSEVEYHAMAASSGQALAGQADVARAISRVTDFLAGNRNSFRVPAAIELLGDLHVANGDYAAARDQYAKLGKPPRAYYKLKSALLVGRTWQAEGDHQQALTQFDLVAESTETGPTIEPILLAATLDRAVSQAATGNAAQAAAAINKIVADADPDDAELLARAYNALGEAHLKAGDSQAALMAYLHVDLLFSSAGSAHAKALSRLTSLWKKAGRPDRSSQAAAKLAKLYPNSALTNP